MALKKCPRCELNYCKTDAEFCDVCMRELSHLGKRNKEQEEDEIIICTECGENPAVPGHELCMECLKEQRRLQEFENTVDTDEDDDKDFADTDDEDID